MIKINENYNNLQGSYLFSEINKRVKEFSSKNPSAKIIRLGIGDVTLPLPNSVINGLKNAVDEMSNISTFKGYGPEQGYEFLREIIIKNDFNTRGIDLSPDEVFISTGAKEDTANIQELFANDIKIAIPDPVYPVYVDSNVMAGRSGKFINGRYLNFYYLEGNEENNFIPDLPNEKIDLIYLCYPNNPTGQVITKDVLKKWVDYAIENKSIILYDAAYEAYIQDPNIPHSIYEIEDAKKVAIEFRSLSKTAGFTGTRCSYTIIPHDVYGYDSSGNKYSINKLWFRRQSTKFNGVAYIIQKGAYYVFTENGRQDVKNMIDYYLNNAKIITDGLKFLNLKFWGGTNSPYIWFKTPNNISSWEFFDILLNKCQIVCTPGSGFGKCGEGYIRLSSYGLKENIIEAVDRIKKILK